MELGDQGTLAQRSNYGDQVYISIPDAIHNTLAHELGHAFYLSHSGDATFSYFDSPNYPAFTAENFMWSYSETGLTVTSGEVFRAIFDSLSMVNLNGLAAASSTGL